MLMVETSDQASHLNCLQDSASSIVIHLARAV